MHSIFPLQYGTKLFGTIAHQSFQSKIVCIQAESSRVVEAWLLRLRSCSMKTPPSCIHHGGSGGCIQTPWDRDRSRNTSPLPPSISVGGAKFIRIRTKHVFQQRSFYRTERPTSRDTFFASDVESNNIVHVVVGVVAIATRHCSQKNLHMITMVRFIHSFIRSIVCLFQLKHKTIERNCTKSVARLFLLRLFD